MVISLDGGAIPPTSTITFRQLQITAKGYGLSRRNPINFSQLHSKLIQGMSSHRSTAKVTNYVILVAVLVAVLFLVTVTRLLPGWRLGD